MAKVKTQLDIVAIAFDELYDAVDGAPFHPYSALIQEKLDNLLMELIELGVPLSTP